MTSDRLQRYALGVLSHVALIAAWHFFVVLGHIPSVVMPSPWATVHALVVPNYRWGENLLATAAEIFAGYSIAVAVGIALAVLFTWFRFLEMLLMPLLVSLNMIPKVALAPLLLVWFSYG
jgi:NitT/TauT family transport system permease protein